MGEKGIEKSGQRNGMAPAAAATASSKAASMPPAEGSEVSSADVRKHHERILEQLRLDKDPCEIFLNELTFDEYEFKSGPDTVRNNILQAIVEEVVDAKPGTLTYNEVTKKAITWLLDEEPILMQDGTPGRNLLDLAITGDEGVCIELVKQLCEVGLKGASVANGTHDHEAQGPSRTGTSSGEVVEVHWHHLLQDKQDTCLHKAIQLKKTRYALYLVQRVRVNGAAKTVLGHQGHDGLTPLHLAVSFKYLTPNQHELVKELIEAYPDALISGTQFQEEAESPKPGKPGTRPNQSHNSAEISRMKVSSSSPYQHFRYTREQPGPQQNSQTDTTAWLARRRQKTRPATKSMAGELKEVAEAIESLLKLSCMRYFGHRREVIKELLPANVGQIHFDLNPRREVSKDLLMALAGRSGITQFEDTLQYVSIPNLCVINMEIPKDSAREEGWRSSNRKDYVYIFDWLRSESIGVKQILKIIVEDDDHNFHSDEAIEFALKGFKVESWNWMRSDMCSHVIKKAAPTVRDLTLYWSGNNAILRSWAADDGLPQLGELRTVSIIKQKTIESVQRTKENMGAFKEDFRKTWRAVNNRDRPAPTISFLSDQTKKIVVKVLAEAERAGRERKERWLNCMESYANFLTIYFRNNSLEKDREIRVAVIDDGVNLDHPDVRGNIVEGETFYNNNGHWQGFYQSSQGHGTLMASIICQICPKVKLYVAKLNEEWVNLQSQITAKSAADAIDWAIAKEVDIISMSWSIENPGEGESALRTAMERAVQNNILLFCASNDQGNQGSERPYPSRIVKDKSFYIGAATVWGRVDPAVHQIIDYTTPGAEEVKEPMSSAPTAAAVAATMPSQMAVGTPEPQIGSSIATARVAGLAAAMLQSILAIKGGQAREAMRTHDRAKKMLNYLAQEGEKYLQVWKIFDEPNRPRAGVRNAEVQALTEIAEKLVSISSL